MNSPIFIVGCPRSGTTLLSVLLDRHSEIAISPETDFYNDVWPRLSEGQTPVLIPLLSDWRRLPELGLEAKDVVEHCGNNPTAAGLLGGILELYAQGRSKKRSGEKTPQHLWHVPRILADFPNSRILCLVRDGRDVALSLAAMPWWTGGLDSGVRTWLDAIRLSDTFELRFPSQFRSVRYEYLVNHTQPALVSIMEFLGLDFEPRQLSSQPSRVVLSRSMEWKGLALQPIDKSRVGHRRCSAGAADIDSLNDVLGPTLQRLGYPLTGSSDPVSG